MAKRTDIPPDDAYSSRVSKVNLMNTNGRPVSDTNRLPVNANLEVGDIEIGAVEIKDGETDTRQKVTTEHLAFSKDERDNGACVVSGNYGYKADEVEGARMTPLITDQDDGLVAPGQIPQLVISEMHYYDDKSQAWRRWEGDDGYAWVYVTNFPETDYRDDSSFTVESDRGVAIGGVATSDNVNVGDFGVFRITTDRSLVTTINNTTYLTDDNSISTGNETMSNIVLSYGYNIDTGDWNRLQLSSSSNLNINIEELGNDVSTNSNTQLKVTNFDSSGTEGVKLLDSEGNLYTAINPVPITDSSLDGFSEIIIESNEGDNIRTSNVNQEILLNSILKEIKKLNLHLSILTDNDIKNTEVE